MSAALGAALQKGQTMRDLLARLQGVSIAGKAVGVTLEDRGVPYLDNRVEAWTDGPPTSTVEFVISAADPDGAHWRRWTIAKVGPGKYLLGCFPTPFNNGRDPLAPGVPPTSSRRA